MSIVQKALITGGLGFIGSYLVNHLLKLGFHVTVIDQRAIKGSPLQNFDILSHPNLKIYSDNHVSILEDNLIEKIGLDFDFVVHAAAILGIDFVNQHPLQTMTVNGIGTYNILQYTKNLNNLKRFIYFSTSEIYGPNSSSSEEQAPAIIPNTGIRWNYSCSKLFGEYLVKSTIQEWKLPAVIIRPFNVYGPYRTGSNAMTKLIQYSLNNKSLVLTGQGTQKRSWCYIDDFIDGVYSCISNPSAVHESFNIGNSNCYISIHDLAKLIIELSGSKSDIICNDEIMEDVLDRNPNIQKAYHLLNYNPKVNLRNGIQKVIDWFRVEKPIFAG